MKIRKIALFLPKPTPFYIGMNQKMRRGFAQLGVEVVGELSILEPAALREFCLRERPQAVMEMNRSKCEAEGLPADMLHIAWIVDLKGRSRERFDEFAGSDVTYFFGAGWEQHFPYETMHGWLGPGTDPELFPHQAPRHEFGASFVGHIPLPWSQALLDRPIAQGHSSLRFGDLLPPMLAWLCEAPSSAAPTHKEPSAFADAFCRKHAGTGLRQDPTLLYDINVRALRCERRKAMAEAMLRAKIPVAFFGSKKNWQAWSNFAPHYKRCLETLAELHEVYTGSTINVHEGNGIHFRAMDVMASGGLLFCAENWNDSLPGGILNFFTPHEDYVPFVFENLPERIAQYLGDPKRAQGIRDSAQAKVRAGHTWRHRAQKILDDLRAL